jgi:mono/diheme cytochrome c family protein
MRALALACVCALCSAATSAALQTEPPAGKVPYERVCGVCHGPEGRGNAAPRLVPIEMDYDELVAKVREGGGQMPPVSEQSVSDEEVRQILQYLRSLAADK